MRIYMSFFYKLKQRLAYYKEDVIFAKRFFYVPWRKKIILLPTPEHTNIGDSALVVAEMKLFEDYYEGKCVEVTKEEYRRFKKVVLWCTRKKDYIAIQAGGNMGNVWQLEEDCRRDIIKSFGENNIISLPQTIYYENSEKGQESLKESVEIYSKHKNLILVAREKYSYEIMKNVYINNKVILTPDLGLYLMYNGRTLKRSGIALCLRNDVEKSLSEADRDKIVDFMENKNYWFTDMYSKEQPTKSNRKRIVNEKLIEFAGAELVITDRLHGMIFAAITETPCVVMSNNHHKVKGVYEWIKNLDYVEFVENVDEVPEAMKRVMSVRDRHYSNERLKPYFQQIIKEINGAK